MPSLLFGVSQLISGALELLSPVAAFLFTLLQLLL